MSINGTPVYVICDADAVERGDGKAFSLSRIDAAGGSRPFPIFIVRSDADKYFAYVNICPHEKTWLNIGSGMFFDEDRTYLTCGRHGAKFVIETGVCVEGPCKEHHLESIPVVVIDGEVCVCGIELVEEDGFPDPFADYDETMEIMIHPD
jgi:nitrite reductase/ring-hydroxylating ferredoxin subunit